MLKWVKSITVFLKSNLLAIILMVFFLLDAVNFFIDKAVGLTFANSVSFYIKGLIQIILLCYLFFKLKDRYLFWLIIVVLMIPMIWCFIYFVQNSTSQNDCYIMLRYSSKYLFSVILFLSFAELPNSLKKNALTVFEWIFILSAILVILSALFQISFFSTYGINRFGYKPLIAAQNEISFWWIIGIIYFLRKHELRSSHNNLLLLFVVGIAGMLLGTKATIIFIFILFFYLLLLSTIDSRFKFWGFIVLILSMMLFLYFSGIFGYFLDFYKERGLLISFTSKRSLLVQERVPVVLSTWCWYNYLIGGISSIRYLTEMDLIDIFMMFGVLGSIGYLFLLWKTLFHFSNKNRAGWLLGFSFIFVGGFGGHVFQSGVCAIYLALGCLYLQHKHVSV